MYSVATSRKHLHLKFSYKKQEMYHNSRKFCYKNFVPRKMMIIFYTETSDTIYSKYMMHIDMIKNTVTQNFQQKIYK